MEKKYKILKNKGRRKIPFSNKYKYRIQALKDFGDVKAGDIGGFVENENNLSQEGLCWIYDDAYCGNDARILHNAKMYNNSFACGKACLLDNVRMYDNSIITDNCYARDNVILSGNAVISENVRLYNNVFIKDAYVKGDMFIYQDVNISGKFNITEDVDFTGDAIISNRSDFIVFQEWWNQGRKIVWTKSNNKYFVNGHSLWYKEKSDSMLRGFYGTSKELLKFVEDKESVREYKRIFKYINEICNT